MRSPHCRRQIENSPRGDLAPLASGVADHPFNRNGVGEGLMNSLPRSLPRRGPLPKIGEMLATLEALAARIAARLCVGPLGPKFRSTNEAGTLGSKWSHLPVYVGSVTVGA
jgi:hypothetical protein